ncbi:MAG: hypothetical protein EOP09_02035 [Proteobacteria bacterium]|nr:MAG: hypothetical protein EOP09_02035 [Pseudomonadota bacterium]
MTTLHLCRSCLRQNGLKGEADELVAELKDRTRALNWELAITGCKRLCPPTGTSLVIEDETLYPNGRLSLCSYFSADRIMKEAQNLMKVGEKAKK